MGLLYEEKQKKVIETFGPDYSSFVNIAGARSYCCECGSKREIEKGEFYVQDAYWKAHFPVCYAARTRKELELLRQHLALTEKAIKTKGDLIC